MTNEEKINLIGQKILVLSNSLEKYQAELASLRLQLEALQQAQEKNPVTPPPVAEQEKAVPLTRQPVVAPEPLIPAAPTTKPLRFKVPPPPKSAPGLNFEEFIGGRLISIIGIVVLIIGLGIGVKYAIDRDLINPLTRIVLAYVAGAILLLLAFRLKQKFRPFSAVLLGGAMASLYFTTYIAYSMYELFPRMAAFAIMLLFTAFTVYAATIYALEVIAVIGLVGAYAVPLLLSDGSGRIGILFTYMLIINSGILVLSFKKYWQVLNHTAFGLTWLTVGTWMALKFDPALHTLLLLSFGFLFFLIFYISNMSYKILRQEKFSVPDIVRLLSNSFLFFGIGYAALNHEGTRQYLGLFTLGNALVHLVFSYIVFRNKLLDRKLFYLLIALVLAFITIAVPVQLEGNWVTLTWSSEAALLFIIGRYRHIVFYENMGLILLILSALSLAGDWQSAYSAIDYAEKPALQAMPALNINFFTSLFFVASLAAMTQVHLKQERNATDQRTIQLYHIIDYALPALLLLFSYLTFYNEIRMYFSIRFRQSALTDAVDTWDFSYTAFSTVAVHCYNFIFFSLATVLAARKWKLPLVHWIAAGLNIIVIFWFLVSGLDALADLRDRYLDPEVNAYYPSGYWSIDVRYVCFALLALLLWLTHLLLKKETFRTEFFARLYDGCIMHLFILAVLSSELINISILHNYTKAYNYYNDTHTAYKLGFTCLWGIYSFVMIARGIFRRNRIMRISAISLFGITLVKLVTFDTWDLSTGYKIIAFILLGAILLTVAFLYQKFKQLIFGSDGPETSQPASTDEH